MSIWPSESAATTRVPLPRSRRQPHQAGRVKNKNERKDSFRVAEIFSLFAASENDGCDVSNETLGGKDESGCVVSPDD